MGEKRGQLLAAAPGTGAGRGGCGGPKMQQGAGEILKTFISVRSAGWGRAGAEGSACSGLLRRVKFNRRQSEVVCWGRALRL